MAEVIVSKIGTGGVILMLLFVAVVASTIVSSITVSMEEMEELEDAEWVIAEYCNCKNNCYDCKKFDKEKQICKYRETIPGKWHIGGDD